MFSRATRPFSRNNNKNGESSNATSIKASSSPAPPSNSSPHNGLAAATTSQQNVNTLTNRSLPQQAMLHAAHSTENNFAFISSSNNSHELVSPSYSDASEHAAEQSQCRRHPNKIMANNGNTSAAAAAVMIDGFVKSTSKDSALDIVDASRATSICSCSHQSLCSSVGGCVPASTSNNDDGDELSVLKLEIGKLRRELKRDKERCSRLALLEAELETIRSTHSDLEASSVRSERMQQLLRTKLEAEIVRLKNQLAAATAANEPLPSTENVSTEPATAQQHLNSSNTNRLLAATIQQNRQLRELNARQELELLKQRENLNEMRRHIETLEQALASTAFYDEQRCQQSEHVQHAFNNFQMVTRAREEQEAELRSQLQAEIEHLRVQIISMSTAMTTTTKAGSEQQIFRSSEQVRIVPPVAAPEHAIAVASNTDTRAGECAGAGGGLSRSDGFLCRQHYPAAAAALSAAVCRQPVIPPQPKYCYFLASSNNNNVVVEPHHTNHNQTHTNSASISSTNSSVQNTPAAAVMTTTTAPPPSYQEHISSHAAAATTAAYNRNLNHRCSLPAPNSASSLSSLSLNQHHQQLKSINSSNSNITATTATMATDEIAARVHLLELHMADNDRFLAKLRQQSVSVGHEAATATVATTAPQPPPLPAHHVQQYISNNNSAEIADSKQTILSSSSDNNNNRNNTASNNNNGNWIMHQDHSRTVSQLTFITHHDSGGNNDSIVSDHSSNLNNHAQQPVPSSSSSSSSSSSPAYLDARYCADRNTLLIPRISLNVQNSVSQYGPSKCYKLTAAKTSSSTDSAAVTAGVDDDHDGAVNTPLHNSNNNAAVDAEEHADEHSIVRRLQKEAGLLK